jgi:hypothetical protein
VPAGSAGASAVHDEPFQLSASGAFVPSALTEYPTATHEVRLAHETLGRSFVSAPEAAGTEVTLHLPRPLSDSASGSSVPAAFSELPTAMHTPAAGHETPNSPASAAPAGSAAVPIDQPAARVQFSTSGTYAPLLVSYSPTAVHSPPGEQETPKNPAAEDPASVGTDCSRHEIPFHRPASGKTSPEPATS